MNIVYNCNERFAVHTAVSITSLFENNRAADEIHVYILGNGLSEDSAARFAALAARYGTSGDGDGTPFSEKQLAAADEKDAGHDSAAAHTGKIRRIDILDMQDYESALRVYFGGAVDTGSFDLTVLARLFAPSHLPDQVEHYLYLDADTVVLGDLRELWQTELDDRICAMAAEPTIYADTRVELGLRDGEPYFNSGVILTDRLRWEREGITGKCIDFYRSVGRKGLAFPDQDILNRVLKGKVRSLWQGWNFFSNYHYRSYRSLVKQAPWFGKIVSEDAYECAAAKPRIVHFAGAERPWIKGNHNPYRDEYRRYLALSPWKGTEELGGQEGRMLLYHLMNLATRYCPAVRSAASAVYYSMKINAGLHG